MATRYCLDLYLIAQNCLPDQAPALAEVFVHHVIPYIISSQWNFSFWQWLLESEQKRQISRDAMIKK